MSWKNCPRPWCWSCPKAAAASPTACSQAPLGLQIVSRLNLNRPVYSAEEYAYLREFFGRMMAKQGERLVLKKKA